ncbi:uracil phosphoribosyltransferase [Stella humosa]|uniref:Uracil phosphoribosyltransferase n=1 Tax=Stella humosa TaxID=94 RepID=A0A3N1KKB4_9PROT|nr:uracil phosphoribosyltransferase [Stella humosa]ROP81271.1 uracil phosphoribosyltransferase [Stella humosa]BBK32619.1 uracil phosphoribosyltransferase [Stella humosa]
MIHSPTAGSDGVTIVSHALATHYLTTLRDRQTAMPAFRAAMRGLSLILGAEATRDLPLVARPVDTPLETMEAGRLEEDTLFLVSVLRAGEGLLEGLRALVPEARIGHVGLYRDPSTLKPVHYYEHLPPRMDRGLVLVVDPMLATGSSAAAAVDRVKQHGGRHIRLLSVIAAPEGVAAMRAQHPDVRIFVGALDRGLDDHGYIRPGLGDAGDRYFGTV